MRPPLLISTAGPIIVIVAPWPFERVIPAWLTEMNAPLIADSEFSAWVAKRTPAARWGEPPEVAGAAVFLASDAADYVTGHILYVDGGFSAAY